MPTVTCSEQVRYALEVLPPSVREALEKRLQYLRRMPRMYPVTSDERFPGCRTFWLEPTYRVFYMIAASHDDVYVVAVVQEDVDSAGTGNEY